MWTIVSLRITKAKYETETLIISLKIIYLKIMLNRIKTAKIESVNMDLTEFIEDAFRNWQD